MADDGWIPSIHLTAVPARSPSFETAHIARRVAFRWIGVHLDMGLM